MKDHPTMIRCKIVAYRALKLFPLENRFCFIAPIVVILSNFGSPRVRNRINAELCLSNELEERLEQRTSEILISDFFSHNIIIQNNIAIDLYHFFFFFFLPPAASFYIRTISFCLFNCYEAKNSLHSSSNWAFLVLMFNSIASLRNFLVCWLSNKTPEMSSSRRILFL